MRSFWSSKRVTVTGGAGFLGQHLVNRLESYGAKVFVPRQRDYNLVALDSCLRCLLEHPSDVVFHTAAYYGGIGINQSEPAKLYYSNLVMGANLMEAARLAKAGKVVNIGTACSYPGYLEGDLKEADLWNGSCHASVVNYGLTKKMLAVQGQAYKKQYGLDSVHLILTNLYGPGDSYNPDRSHVVAALVRKWVEADLASRAEHRGLGHRQADPRIHLCRGLCRCDRVGRGKVQRRRHAAEYWHGHRHLDPRACRDDQRRDGVQGQDRLERRQARRSAEESTRCDPDEARARRLGAAHEPSRGLAKTIAWYRANKAQADAKW